jgi:GntR family transcriptional regulator/MocR family aminotransferase
VYTQLAAEGHVATALGSGTRVAERARPTGPPGPAGRLASAWAPMPDPLPRAFATSNPGRPDPALFPRREWQRALAAAVRELSDADLSYGDPRGLAELRVALASYVARVRSIAASPEQVIVVNGFAQGLVCVTRLLVRVHGEPAVAIEDPGSTGTIDQLTAWGARVIPIPVDAAGLDVGALDRSAAQAVVVTPAHQYPTGVTLAPDRRHALIAWARRRDALIIEDDYDAEYRYDRAPLTSLHNLDPDRVIAGGSTSKSLSPALRLGWLTVPAGLADTFAEIKASIDLGAPTIPQAALARFITSGSLDRHIRRTRSVYRRRRDALVNTLHDSAPGLHLDGIAAGLHVVIRLDDDVDENELAERAVRLGLDAQPLGRYRCRPDRLGLNGLVLGYARQPPHQLQRAVAELFGDPDRS